MNILVYSKLSLRLAAQELLAPEQAWFFVFLVLSQGSYMRYVSETGLELAFINGSYLT